MLSAERPEFLHALRCEEVPLALNSAPGLTSGFTSGFTFGESFFFCVVELVFVVPGPDSALFRECLYLRISGEMFKRVLGFFEEGIAHC